MIKTLPTPMFGGFLCVYKSVDFLFPQFYFVFQSTLNPTTFTPLIYIKIYILFNILIGKYFLSL